MNEIMRCKISRTPSGVRVNLILHPRVEDFLSLNGVKDKPFLGLQCYVTPVEGVLHWKESVFRLDRADKSFDPIYDDGDRVFNASILRLRGSSAEGGVTAEIRGVYSTRLLRRWAAALRDAVAYLWAEYLHDVEIDVVVTAGGDR